jgi:hypothetical protein
MIPQLLTTFREREGASERTNLVAMDHRRSRIFEQQFCCTWIKMVEGCCAIGPDSELALLYKPPFPRIQRN